MRRVNENETSSHDIYVFDDVEKITRSVCVLYRVLVSNLLLSIGIFVVVIL